MEVDASDLAIQLASLRRWGNPVRSLGALRLSSRAASSKATPASRGGYSKFPFLFSQRAGIGFEIQVRRSFLMIW